MTMYAVDSVNGTAPDAVFAGCSAALASPLRWRPEATVAAPALALPTPSTTGVGSHGVRGGAPQHTTSPFGYRGVIAFDRTYTTRLGPHLGSPPV